LSRVVFPGVSSVVHNVYYKFSSKMMAEQVTTNNSSGCGDTLDTSHMTSSLTSRSTTPLFMSRLSTSITSAASSASAHLLQHSSTTATAATSANATATASNASTTTSTKVPSGLRKHPFFQGEFLSRQFSRTINKTSMKTIPALRTQLSDQLRSLELRLDGQICVTGELVEYFRRRGEIETEIGKTLDKHHRKELLHKQQQR